MTMMTIMRVMTVMMKIRQQYTPPLCIGKASSNGKPEHCTLSPFLLICISLSCISVSLYSCISVSPPQPVYWKGPPVMENEHRAPLPPFPFYSKNICSSTHYEWKHRLFSSDFPYFIIAAVSERNHNCDALSQCGDTNPPFTINQPLIYCLQLMVGGTIDGG